MEALETALGYWEDALAAYTSGLTGGVALTSQDEAEFTALLQRVIDDAYSLQDQCEHLFLHQVSDGRLWDGCVHGLCVCG